MNELRPVKSYEITRASITEALELNMSFESVVAATEFTGILSVLKRAADIDLGKQHFTVSQLEETPDIRLSGNLFNAIALIKRDRLISKTSLKQHIEVADIEQAIAKSKEIFLDQKKTEKQQQNTPEKLVAAFTIAATLPTEKKSGSCFCVRKNKK